MLLLSLLPCTWFPFLSCLCSFVNLQRPFMFFKGLQNSLKLSNCLFPCAFSFNCLFTVPAVWHKVTNFKQFRHTTFCTKSLCRCVYSQYLFLLLMYRLSSIDFFSILCLHFPNKDHIIPFLPVLNNGFYIFSQDDNSLMVFLLVSSSRGCIEVFHWGHLCNSIATNIWTLSLVKEALQYYTKVHISSNIQKTLICCWGKCCHILCKKR